MIRRAQRVFIRRVDAGADASLAALLTLALIGGCAASGPTERAQLLETGDLDAAAAPLPSWPRNDWWTDYGDEQLSGLIAAALADNPSLRASEARVRKAQALSDVAGARRFPELSLGASATRQRLSEFDLFPPPLAGSTITQSRLTLDFSYELDFWGKNRALLKAALSQERAAEAEFQAARLMLSSAVAKTYFQLQRAQQTRAVLARAIEQRRQILDLTEQRVSAGLDTNAELRQAQATLPSARQELAATDENIELLRHQLAALRGIGPDAVAAMVAQARVPMQLDLPVQLPLDLLGRRADLIAACWRVEAAAQDIAEARARFYPNVNLLAFAGFSSISLSKLLETGSRTAGLGPAIRLPLFEGGQLRANLAGKNADYDAAVGHYNAALLEALREVADALSSLRAVADQQREQAAAQLATEQAYDLVLLRYRAGLASYLTVLVAENAVLSQRRLHVDLDARALDAGVNLIRALGGGYRSDPPSFAERRTPRPPQESNHE